MSATGIVHRVNAAILPRQTAAASGRRVAFSSGSGVSMKCCYTRTRLGGSCSVRTSGRPGRSAVRVLAYASEISDEAYICLGLAQCYRKDSGSLVPVVVIEPLSASSLECLANGARTSYKQVTGVNFGDAFQRNRSVLPEAFREAAFCDNYEFRCEAAARTWQRDHAQENLMDIVPLGKVRSNFNFSLEDKRVLNMDNVVNDADNVKQDMSIDVYGRKKSDDSKKKDTENAVQAAEAAAATKKQKEEDDLDALLLA